MIKVNNLTKRFGSFEALKSISFEVKAGSVSGFLGPNGAGKTTTMNILTGLTGYDGGEVIIDGRELLRDKKALMRKVGYLPENPVFYNYMNAYEYLNLIGTVGGYNRGKIKNRIDELLDIVKLTGDAKRRIGGYSRGMRQRMGLAAALFNDPEILFLDEPTSALDPEGRMDMMNLIDNLKERGKTVFLSTHILNDVERVCSELNILNHGEILFSGSLKNLENEYIQPIYDIEFEHDCSDIKDELKRNDWVVDIKSMGNTMSVYVKNYEAAGNMLLSKVSGHDNLIVSYNLRKSSLEDIFMRLVK